MRSILRQQFLSFFLMFSTSAAWAKTNFKKIDDPEFRWLSVRGHAIDASAACMTLLSGSTLKAFEKAAGRPLTGPDIERICVLVGLHDIGKVLNGFRSQLEKPFGNEEFSCHIRPMFKLLQGMRRSLRVLTPKSRAYVSASGIETVLSWFADHDSGMRGLKVLMSHHGGCRSSDPVLPFDPQLEPNGDTSASLEASAVLAAMQELFPAAFSESDQPLPDTELFFHLFLGLAQTCDWIASSTGGFNGNKAYFSLDGDAFTSCDRYQSSLKICQSLLAANGFHGSFSRNVTVTSKDILNGRQLRPLQKVALNIPVESKILGLEAPTGEGKTEAALLRFFTLYRAGLVDGMYFAVPTRSAGVSLFNRIRDVMERLFPNAPLPVLAMPGAALREQDMLEGRISWAAENGNFLTAGIAIGTVDQLMLSGLRTRNSQQKAFSAARLFHVIDEIHSFDLHMTTILGNVLHLHQLLGGYTMFMSATFGNVGLAALGGKALPFAEACKMPYPVAWHGPDMGHLEFEAFDADPTRSRVVDLETGSDEEALRSAADAASKGASVLAIFSTVALATAFQKRLEAMKVPTLTIDCDGFSIPVVHHGRYSAADRKLLDEKVMTALGTDPSLRGGRVIVGTQSVEQSLDIDADYLITDLCPMEVMLQRMGRLFRKSMERPEGYRHPKAFVIVPDASLSWLTDEGSIIGANVPQLYVYKNALQLLATRLELASGTFDIPRQNRELVERCTHPEQMEKLAIRNGEAWLKHYRKLQNSETGEAAKARNMLVRWHAHPDDLCNLMHPGRDDIYTRLGCDHVVVPVQFQSFSGEMVDAITIKAHWLRETPTDVKVSDVVQSDGVTLFTVNGHSFRYDRMGLSKH